MGFWMNYMQRSSNMNNINNGIGCLKMRVITVPSRFRIIKVSPTLFTLNGGCLHELRTNNIITTIIK